MAWQVFLLAAGLAAGWFGRRHFERRRRLRLTRK